MVEQGLQMLNNWPPGLKGFIIGIAANFATSFIAVLGKRSVRLIVDPEIEKRVKECYQVAAVLLVGELRKQGWSETRLAALFSIMGLRNVEEAIVRVVLDEANPLEAGVGEAFEVGVVRELETSAPSEEIKQVVDDVVVKAFLPKLYRLLAQTIKDPNSRFIEILQREGFSRVMEKLQLVLDRLESQKQLPKTTSVPWNIPYEKNPWFTGRDNIITELANALSKDSVGALMQAVSGLGGIGKTQVAVEYAYRNRDKYNAVFWVRADTTLDLSSGFLEMAKLLDLPEKDARDSNEAVSAVKRWLQGNSGWLLILDNADNPELVKEFRPLNPQGHILLTSRAQVFQILGISRPVEIDEMSPSEALEFLYKRTGREESDGAEKEATAELAKELGYLPLALEQAAAYMTAMQAPFQDYLASYLKRRLGLLAQSGPVAGDYKKSVATTWAMNFSEVAKESKAAADLLRVSAFLAPDSIPLELIKEGASQLGPTLSAAIGQAKDDRLAISEILEPLTRYSLIRRDVDAHTYSIHRMVQEVLKYGMDPDTQKLWAERAIRAVNRAFPFIEFANWPLCDRLLPQGMAAMSLIEKYGFEFQDAGHIFNQLGVYLYYRGNYTGAAPLFKRSLVIREKALGPEHPDVATSLENYAGLLRKTNRITEAIEMEARAKRIRSKQTRKG